MKFFSLTIIFYVLVGQFNYVKGAEKWIITAPEKNKKICTLNILVVPVDFKDTKVQMTKKEIEEIFFKLGSKDRYGINLKDRYSVAEYYFINSYKKFEIKGHVIPPGTITLSRKKKYYKKENEGSVITIKKADYFFEEVTDAISHYLEKQNLKRLNYDANEDSYIDVICYIYAGNRNFGVPFTHSHIYSTRKSIRGKSIKKSSLQGLKFGRYFIIEEIVNKAGTTVFEKFPIGIPCHEIAHLLGLPDLYTGRGTEKEMKGIGKISLMSIGTYGSRNDEGIFGTIPAPIISVHKILLGWVKPIVINKTSREAFIIEDYSNPYSNKVVYKVIGKNPNEYWLIENRQRTHFDAIFTGKGLFIWHINESLFQKGRDKFSYLKYFINKEKLVEAIQFEDPRAKTPHPINKLNHDKVNQSFFWYRSPKGITPTTFPSTLYSNSKTSSNISIYNIGPTYHKKMLFKVSFNKSKKRYKR